MIKRVSNGARQPVAAITAVLVVLSLWLQGAHAADTVIATLDGTPSGGSVEIRKPSGSSFIWEAVPYGGSIHATRTADPPTGGTFAGQLLPGDGDTSRGFLTFCGEQNQSISTSTYTFDVNPLSSTSNPDIGETKAKQIKQILYHVYPAFGQPLTAERGLALQMVIWEIELEPGTGPYSLTGGTIRFRSASPSGARGLGNRWLNDYINNKPLTSFAHGVVALTHPTAQDLVAQTKQGSSTLCRKLRLYSNGPVSGIGPMYGGAALTATLRSDGKYDLALDLTDGVFTDNGLIYNDGQFPPSTPAPCSSATDQCFPNQNPTPYFVATLGDFSWGTGAFDLNTWQVTGGGDTITFGSGGTYTYSGKFAGTGTYKMVDCTAAVPEPGPLALMLLPLAGLWVVRRRRRRV